MNAAVALFGSRVRLRLWRAEDREPFALMNSDARAMKFFRSPLGRVESDKLVDRIQKHFEDKASDCGAIEVPGTAPFIGFCGLSVARFSAHFTPCAEVGWRIAYEHWGQGYATEAAKVAVGYGFSELDLPEIVSFTSKCNLRSRAVMERLGMRQDPADDFDHPGLPPEHPLARHVMYRLKNKVRDGDLSLEPMVR